MNAVDKHNDPASRSPAATPRASLLRTLGFYAFVYLISLLVALPWLIPRMPRTKAAWLFLLFFAGPFYLFVEWLGEKLNLHEERTRPRKLLTATLIAVAAMALALLSDS